MPPRERRRRCRPRTCKPLSRPVEMVLADVISGYVSLEAAGRDYGVVVRYVGRPDQLVRLPEHHVVDEEETARLRAGR